MGEHPEVARGRPEGLRQEDRPEVARGRPEGLRQEVASRRRGDRRDHRRRGALRRVGHREAANRRREDRRDHHHREEGPTLRRHPEEDRNHRLPCDS